MARPVAVPSYISRQVTRAQRFYLDVPRRTKMPAEIVCGGLEEVAGDYVVDRPDFPFFALEFVAAGTGRLVLNGKPLELRPGVLFAYGPGWSQHIETDPHDRLVKYFINWVAKPSYSLLRECGLSPGESVRVGSVAAVRDVFDQLVHFGARGSRLAGRICATLLDTVALVVAEGAERNEEGERGGRATFERCRAAADAHFLTLRTARELAALGHVDVAYLCRLFRRFAGISPYHYLRRLKMNWAAERLHAGEVMVREVADQLGVDPFQFSRSFRRVHGQSPSTFRKLRVGG